MYYSIGEILKKFEWKIKNEHEALTGSFYQQWISPNGFYYVTLRYSDHFSWDVFWNGQGNIPISFDTEIRRTSKKSMKMILRLVLSPSISDKTIKRARVDTKEGVDALIDLNNHLSTIGAPDSFDVSRFTFDDPRYWMQQ